MTCPLTRVKADKSNEAILGSELTDRYEDTKVNAGIDTNVSTLLLDSSRYDERYINALKPTIVRA